jgi:hypothetical protein
MKTDKSKRKAFHILRYYQSIPSSTITSNQPPAWFHALQIGVGIISLILSILLIVTQYPVLAVDTIITHDCIRGYRKIIIRRNIEKESR